MKKTPRFFFLFVLLLPCSLHAQPHAAKAQAIAQQARNAYRQADISGAIRLMHSAAMMDSANAKYHYQLAVWLIEAGNPDAALAPGTKALRCANANDSCFVLMMRLQRRDSAEVKKLSEEALARFPDSGPLYEELANRERDEKGHATLRAVILHEKGIAAAPAYLPNYRGAAEALLWSDEAQWGMIYAELYILLRRETPLTQTVNADYDELALASLKPALHAAYVRELEIGGLNQYKISFCDPARNKFCYAYLQCLQLSIQNESALNLASLSRIRKRFVENYYEKKYNEKFPNALFDYHQQLIGAGHFEAYNYWLFGYDNHEEFLHWKEKHEEEWAAFLAWRALHPLKIDAQNKFVRTQD